MGNFQEWYRCGSCPPGKTDRHLPQTEARLSAYTKDGVTDYVWLFILCGLPFGIPRMFAWIVPGGSLGTALPLFLLNFIIGGVIGGFVLVWRLLVAAWYIPLTIYRLITARGTSYIPE